MPLIWSPRMKDYVSIGFKKCFMYRPLSVGGYELQMDEVEEIEEELNSHNQAIDLLRIDETRVRYPWLSGWAKRLVKLQD